MINDDYSNVSFWERYCDSTLARTVACCIPDYWKRFHAWYGQVYPNLEYTSEMANRAAYRWAKSHLADLDRLSWPAGDSFPSQYIDTTSSDHYPTTIVQFASEFVRSATPIRPHWPLRPNPTPLGDGTYYLRGVRLGEQKLIQNLLHPRRTLLTKYLRWGPQLLDFKKAETSHFCVAGVTRSGKTTLLLLLAQSILPDHGRVIFFDAKSVLLNRLVSPDADAAKWFHILNPFDRRCVAWDIAADADTQRRANEVAAMLFPTQPNDKPYFVEASRRLAAAVIEILNEVVPKEWTFLDFLLALRPTNIYATLRRHPSGRELTATYLRKDSITTENLISTLDSRLDPYLPIAAAWSKAKEKLSLREWAGNSHRSLLLGHSHSHQLAMSRVNRVIVRLLSDALLDSQIEKPSRTFVFLDELESLGYIESLPDLLNLGAEVGVTMALGFHDLDTLKAIYGHQTEGLLAMCSNMAILRLNSRSTASWAADLFGTQEVLVANRQEMQRTNPSTEAEDDEIVQVTLSEQRIERHAVSTNQLTQLPLTSPTYGMAGYFVSHLHPAYLGRIAPRELFPDESPGAKLMEDLVELGDSLKGKSSRAKGKRALLWRQNSTSCFVPRPESDFVVPPDAVPNFAKDEIYAPKHLEKPFKIEPEGEVDGEQGQSDAISPDADQDAFELRPIQLRPIERKS